MHSLIRSRFFGSAGAGKNHAQLVIIFFALFSILTLYSFRQNQEVELVGAHLAVAVRLAGASERIEPSHWGSVEPSRLVGALLARGCGDRGG
jgi:hypothetical protein